MNTCSVDFDSEIVIIPDGVEMIDYDFISKFKNLKKIILPNTLKYIDNETFKNCTTLEEISIPDSIEQIGYEAFSGCSSLKKINLPNKYFYIQPYAFKDCTSLIEFTLPSEIKYLEEEIFYGCTNLKKLNCSQEIEHIEPYALYNCKNLRGFQISKTTKFIGEFAMYGCDSIEKIIIPACTEKIEVGAFSMMPSLRTIMVDRQNKKYLSTTHSSLLIDKENQTILQYAIANDEEEVVLSMLFYDPIQLENENIDIDEEDLDIYTSIESISDYAFAGAKSIKTIHIFLSLEHIGNNTFASCDNLEELIVHCKDQFGKIFLVRTPLANTNDEITHMPFKKINIGYGVRVIGAGNEYLFKNVEEIQLPVGLKEIHYNAFKLNKKLKRVIISGTIETICPNVFNDGVKLSFPTFAPDVNSEDFCFMTTLDRNVFFNIIPREDINKYKEMKIKIILLNDGTYSITMDDFINFVVFKTKDGNNINQEKIDKLLENIKYGFYRGEVNYDLKELLPIDLSSLFNLYKAVIEGNLDNKALQDYLDSNETADRIESLTHEHIVDICFKKNKMENDSLKEILYDISFFPARTIDRICKNYTKALERLLRICLDNNVSSVLIDTDKLFTYCNLLEKYNIKDPYLFNPLFYLLDCWEDGELELFLSKYNKNIKHILINSEATNDDAKKLGYIINLLRCTGCFSDNPKISQRMQTFINEKIFSKDAKNRVAPNDIELFFSGITIRPNEDNDLEFGEFLVKNYDELYKLNNKYNGIIGIIHELFPKLKVRKTSNKGSQRQLKVTLEDCLDYLLISENNEANETYELEQFLNEYYSKNSALDISIKILNESKKAPRNIFTKVTYDIDNNPIYSYDESEDLKETIGSNIFTYEWLPKQSYENLILGKRCDCCSHVLGAGAGIMRASMIRDDCQNLVIRNKLGKIIGKMTLYVNKEKGYGVFNTAEINKEYRECKTLTEIYEAFKRACFAFINEYNKNNEIKLDTITIGEFRNALLYELGDEDCPSFEVPDYSKYEYLVKEENPEVGQHEGDCKNNQILVYSKERGMK